MRYLTTTRLAALETLLFSTVLASGQGLGNSNVQYMQTIGIPGWANSGSAQANYDIFAYNPQTRAMYLADRGNHGITVIDTRTNVFIGIIPMPNNSSPNGALIAPDLQQLVVTDGQNSVFVWDLRVPKPNLAPDQYILPGIGGGTDALDYDPINQTVYVINGPAPNYMTGINLATKTIASQLQLPGSPELMKFNPIDGKIVQVITDGSSKGVVVFDPASNSITATYNNIPNCTGHGIAVDPIANVLLLGCGTNQPQVMLNIKDGTVLKTFPDVTGTDLLDYNPNLRRFYTGSASNVATTSGCSKDSTGNIPVIGVIDALGSVGSGVGELAGVVCAGRNAKVGIDPIQNYVYSPTRQYPVDPNNANSGQNGIMVFRDLTPPPQAPTTLTQAVLAGGAQGSVTMSLVGRSIRVSGYPTGVPGSRAWLVIPTTVGNETVSCAVDPSTSKAVCNETLFGDPLIGSVVTLSVDGNAAARGPITGR